MAITGLTAGSTNNATTNTRNVLDANKIKTIALPNAGNTVNTNYIDLEVAVPYPTTETINVYVTTGASTAANTKNINVVLQTCAANALGVDTANWTNIPTLAAPLMVVVGNATAHAACTCTVKLPPLTVTKQYIRAQATGEADGGDASDGTLTLELLF